MVDVAPEAIVQPPARRGVWGTVRRIGLLRLLVMGAVLIAAYGVTVVFHGEYRRGHLSFAYSPAIDWLVTLSLCAGVMALYAILVRLLEARWPSEAAPRPAMLALGVLLGAGLFCTVYAVYALLGVTSFQGINGFKSVGGILLAAIMAGIGEEVLFRGVLFRVLEDSAGTLIAMLLSAALFGLMHAGNPGATAFSTVAVALEAGFMLAAAYVWSRSLWLPIGVHLAWNFTQGGVFSQRVSGGAATGLLNFPLSARAGPLITGGAFGPEASVVALAVCVSLGVVFTVLAVRAGRWRRLRFRLLLD